MMKQEDKALQRKLTRRKFGSLAGRSALSLTALSATGPLVRGAGQGSPNETLRIGVIGFGVQGHLNARSAAAVENTEVVAASSIYDGHLEAAREVFGPRTQVDRDYRRILDNQDIDAVVVATPDHWHVQAALDSMDAGKDVYCEKPLTHQIEEGDKLVEAVQRTGRILQVGSQHTSSPHVIEARQLIRGGILGQVTQVKASWDHSNEVAAWYWPVPQDASPETVDWDRFLGSAPRRPFEARRVFQWRNYRDYGDSLAGDLLVHIITTLHYMLDLDVPTVAHAVGGHFVWKEGGRDAYDTITASYEYPEGLISVLGASQNNAFDGREIRILGTKATMVLSFNSYTVYEVDDPPGWSYPTRVWPSRLREPFWQEKGISEDRLWPTAEPRKTLKTFEVPPGPRRPYHMEHFLNCVRSRRQPVQDVVMGNNAAVTSHLANLSYDRKVGVRFDRTTRKASPVV